MEKNASRGLDLSYSISEQIKVMRRSTVGIKATNSNTPRRCPATVAGGRSA